MYLLNVNVTASEREVAPFRLTHRDWVKQGITKGWFIFAGPKVEKLGGLILVKSMPLSELKDFIAIDPYIIEKVAEYEIIEFNMSLAQEGFEQIIM